MSVERGSGSFPSDVSAGCCVFLSVSLEEAFKQCSEGTGCLVTGQPHYEHIIGQCWGPPRNAWWCSARTQGLAHPGMVSCPLRSLHSSQKACYCLEMCHLSAQLLDQMPALMCCAPWDISEEARAFHPRLSPLISPLEPTGFRS